MFMNPFRILGDMFHLLSFVVMFWKLRSAQSCAGISLKTQEIYVIIFLARYLDLFWNFLSIYNWIMKVRRCRHHTRPAPLLPTRPCDHARRCGAAEGAGWARGHSEHERLVTCNL